MTRLESKSVRREVDTTYGTLVVEINRAGVRTRLKGTRTWYPVLTWGRVHLQGAELAAAEKRKLRKKTKANRGLLAVGV